MTEFSAQEPGTQQDFSKFAGENESPRCQRCRTETRVDEEAGRNQELFWVWDRTVQKPENEKLGSEYTNCWILLCVYCKELAELRGDVVVVR